MEVSRSWPVYAGDEMAQELSLGCDTHRAGSSELKEMVREKQASS